MGDLQGMPDSRLAVLPGTSLRGHENPLDRASPLLLCARTRAPRRLKAYRSMNW
jgi:hypothetical protein